MVINNIFKGEKIHNDNAEKNYDSDEISSLIKVFGWGGNR